MGLYIFKYCVCMSEYELRTLESIDIEARINSVTYPSRILGSVGHGAPVTDNVFIIKADNYKQCMDLILWHKMTVESSAWQRGTFGEIGTCAGVERYETLANKLHTVRCTNSKGFTDMVVCYKVSEEVKDKMIFFDAVDWARNCKLAVYATYDLGMYAKHLVYKAM